MDILEAHGFTGTFFVEIFCSYLLGFEPIAKVFRAIKSRGHDIQMHLHPVYRFYRDYLESGRRREQDLMFRFSGDEQKLLIIEGINLFRQFAGVPPKAYRAGCYGASELTLRALREGGVLVDSSYNLSYLGRTCGFQNRPLNAPIELEGVREFPVTNFRSGSGYKPLEISAVSVSEIMVTLRSLIQRGCGHAVLVFHSFSFLKHRGVRFEHCRPDWIVMRRFRRLCQELSRLKDEIEVGVLGDVDISRISPQPQVVPSVGWVRPVVRRAIQGLDYIPWL
jgi:hypothetical protein